MSHPISSLLASAFGTGSGQHHVMNAWGIKADPIFLLQRRKRESNPGAVHIRICDQPRGLCQPIAQGHCP